MPRNYTSPPDIAWTPPKVLVHCNNQFMFQNYNIFYQFISIYIKLYHLLLNLRNLYWFYIKFNWFVSTWKKIYEIYQNILIQVMIVDLGMVLFFFNTNYCKLLQTIATIANYCKRLQTIANVFLSFYDVKMHFEWCNSLQ